jgi:hypothetical protein
MSFYDWPSPRTADIKPAAAPDTGSAARHLLPGAASTGSRGHYRVRASDAR